jgi:hypothetical protein
VRPKIARENKAGAQARLGKKKQIYSLPNRASHHNVAPLPLSWVNAPPRARFWRYRFLKKKREGEEAAQPLYDDYKQLRGRFLYFGYCFFGGPGKQPLLKNGAQWSGFFFFIFFFKKRGFAGVIHGNLRHAQTRAYSRFHPSAGGGGRGGGGAEEKIKTKKKNLK